MLHQVYISLGANSNDGQTDINQALKYVQTRASIKKVSSLYEAPAGLPLNQSAFLNMVCELDTELSPDSLFQFLKVIEKRINGRRLIRKSPRSLNVDILFYDEISLDAQNVLIPYPSLHERSLMLVPLAEIAPELKHPVFNMTAKELLNKRGENGVKRKDLNVDLKIEKDLQQARPTVGISLSRTGVTNLRRIIQIEDGGRGVLFYAELDLFVDLNPYQAGVHMSRFSDVLEALVEEISLEPSPDIESLAERLSRQVIRTQNAIYSEVHIRAKSPMQKVTPITGKAVEELYTLIGIAASTDEYTRRIVGVQTEGMTVCPCAQDMVRSYSRDLLKADGFSAEEAERIVDILPMASHNQRGRGTLLIGSEQKVRAENLVHLVEASMSSETYELLKRPDEFFIVNKSHRNPRFVEDVVREMLSNVIESYTDLPDDAFVLAKQENFESIHQHEAFAERFGSIGEVRREISYGEHVLRHTTLEEWLRG